MCCFRLTINKILWRYLKIEKKNGLICQLNWFSLGGKLPDIMGCKLPAWTLLFNWKMCYLSDEVLNIWECGQIKENVTENIQI